MKSVLLGGILGGIVLFVWGWVSWVYLPWHKDTINGFKDEKSVAAVVVANTPKSGIYYLPAMSMDSSTQPEAGQPMIFASVALEGMKPMNTSIVTSLLNQIVAAILVALMLTRTNGLGYARRVGFVVLFAIAAGVVTLVPNWNWHSFDTNYTLVMFGDLIIGWFLAGLVLAKFTSKK